MKTTLRLALLSALFTTNLAQAAGVMREPLWRFLLLVALAKSLRYGVLTAVTLQWVLIPT